jgi:exodeoxyribonuclease-3
VPGAFSLLTWNVNSIRARLDHVLTYLDEHTPDIACLQEVKIEENLFPRVPFMELGYEVHLHCSKGYAGVCTLTREAATEVRAGFGSGPADPHRRLLATLVGGVWVFNLYAPNGTAVGSDAFAYKLDWFRRLRAELDRTMDPSGAVILCGDFNVAPDARDVWDVAAMQGGTHFTSDEHAALREVLAFGLDDCFRRHEDGGGHFTWFDYRAAAWERREGLRIDLVLATAPLAARCTHVVQDLAPRAWDGPSDHVPVRARFAAGG